MIRNHRKRTAAALFSIFAAILFFSCSFIHENKSGRVSFSVSNIIQNSSRAAVAINSTDFLEVSLLGDYTETQTVSIKDASTIVFEEVPLEAQIYAEVYIYRINALNKRYDKYSGKSEPLIVQEGENLLTVKLSPITSGDNPEVNEKTTYTVKHLLQNVEDDGYTLKDTEKKDGIALETTNAVAKAYEGFTTPAEIEQKTIAEDGSTIIEIKYKRKTFTVSYEDSLDGEELTVPEAEVYRYEANVKINFTDIETRDGYKLDGWKDPENGKIYKTDGLTSFTMGLSDVVLYAQWTANVYNITYELNGGAWADGYTPPYTYTYGERQNVPNADKIIQSGFGLTGWYTEDGTKITEISAGMTGDIKLYAQWAAGLTAYSVHHWQQNVSDDDYTEILEDEQVLTGSSGEDTEAAAFSYTGFTPKGFEQKSIESDGSTKIDIYYNRNLHSVTYTSDTSDVTITLPATQESRYGATVNIDFSEVKRSGFEFAGWKDASGNIYKETDETSFTMGDNDVTLTAMWTAATYRITYYSEGEDITETEACESFPKTFTIENSKIDLSEYKLSKTGATFAGWYDNEDFSGTPITSIQTDLLKDITLYAKWTYSKTISITVQSGSWISDPTSSAITLSYGGEVLVEGETIISNSDEIILTATALTGYIYTWKVDGSTTDSSGNVYSSNNTLTLTTTSWKKGIYDIYVQATNGTDYESCFAQIKVGY